MVFGLDSCLLCVVWLWLLVAGLLCGVWLGKVD